MFSEVLRFTLSVTTPVFLWLSLGLILRRLGLLSDKWINRGSWFVFYVSLPVLMFTSMIRQPINQVFQADLVVICALVTVLIMLAARLLTRLKGLDPMDATVMQQGALRGNLGIIGLLLCINAYGEQVLTQASLLMALLTILFNVLSVYIFVDGLREGQFSFKVLAWNLLKNPLIAAIFLALPLAFLDFQLPPVLMDYSDQFVSSTLPIALVCIGATLSYHSLKRDFDKLLSTASLKLLATPLLATTLALIWGLRGQELGIVFLLMASPTAAASFVMTKAYGGNANLAANIVVFTTLAALISTSAGVFLLSYWQLM